MVLMQRASFAVPAQDAHAGKGLGLIWQLIRRPLWWGGVLANAGGFGLQMLALASGPLLLVQPLTLTSLLFALPMSARWAGRPMTRADGVRALVLVAGLATFVIVGAPSGGDHDQPVSKWILPGVVVAVLTIVGLSTAMRRDSPATRRAWWFGAVAGVLLGINAALKVSTVEAMGGGLWNTLISLLTTWQAWALIVVVIFGTLCQQWGYHIAPLSASLPPARTFELLGGMAAGIAIFGEQLKLADGRWAVLIAALAAIVWSTTMLARSAAQGVTAPARRT